MTGKHPALRLLLALLIAGAATFTSSCRPRATAPRVEFTLQKVAFQIGDTKIHALVTQVGESALTMVHLHEDEKTSAEAGRAVLEKHGGRLIQLVHSGRRRVSFSLDGASYSFDPNRIFSRAGVESTLRGGVPVPDKAYAAVNEFAAQFVSYFALRKQHALIAVHNNGEGFLSVHSYAPDAEYAADTAQLFANPAADPDNFYYVTDERFYSALDAQRFNVVLQDNRTVSDDGSLSVFAGRHQIPYINVEAQSGQLAEQIRMLEIAVEVAGKR